jgi:MarR family transcriptional regulator, organic hydroperoxide resistance regulator
MKKRAKDPRPDAPLELDDFLCFSIYATHLAFNRVYQPLLNEIDLTYPQFIAMILLWRRDGQNVGEIGEKLNLQSNTLTPMLKRLERLGYVTRRRNKEDERQVCIYLTDAGVTLRRHAAEIVRRVRIATGLADEGMKNLLDEVGALRRALEDQVSK